MKCLTHIIFALLVISFYSTVGFCEILLYADRKLNLEERKLVVNEMLNVLKKYDSAVPALSPREYEYIENEMKFVRDEFKSQRAQSFIKSREYTIWNIRKKLNPALHIMELLSGLSERHEKYNEIRLWAEVVKLLMAEGITFFYERGMKDGYFEKDLSFDNLMMDGRAEQILEQMVIKQLE